MSPNDFFGHDYTVGDDEVQGEITAPGGEQGDAYTRPPTLGDALELQNAIEALPAVGSKDMSPTERIDVFWYPGDTALSMDEGDRPITHVTLSTKVPDTGRYKAVMNYIVLRTGDETTTRVVKRPPFGGIPDPETTPEPNEMHGAQVRDAVDDYAEAQRMGLFDLTAGEVYDLIETINRHYAPEA